MSDRFKEIRKELKLSQAEFGKRLGVSRDVINNLENARVEPTDLIIKTVCMTFDVNEEWLRNGIGDMFAQKTQTAIDDLCAEYDFDNLDRAMIECYTMLSREQRSAFKDYVKLVADTIKNGGGDLTDTVDGGKSTQAKVLRIANSENGQVQPKYEMIDEEKMEELLNMPNTDQK